MNSKFFAIITTAMLMGCLGTEPEEVKSCDEQQFWYEISTDNPYPGMICEVNGPTKTLAITFFVYKDNEGVNYISNNSSIETGVAFINTVYNPHGIDFAVGEVIYVDVAFPDVTDEEENNKNDSGGDYGDGFSVEDLSEEFEANYNFSNVNIVMVTDGWGAYSMFPWYDRTHYVTFVRASSFETSYVPAHELGHFLGLYHTHQYSSNPDDDSHLDYSSVKLWADDWVVPSEQCYRTGDFVCGTPYDCYNFCEDAIGCSAAFLYQGEKPGQESEYEDCTSEQHSPSLDNLMSRYGDRSVLTDDQGARARYFLQYLVDTNRQGNQLTYSISIS